MVTSYLPRHPAYKVLLVALFLFALAVLRRPPPAGCTPVAWPMTDPSLLAEMRERLDHAPVVTAQDVQDASCAFCLRGRIWLFEEDVCFVNPVALSASVYQTRLENGQQVARPGYLSMRYNGSETVQLFGSTAANAAYALEKLLSVRSLSRSA
jgi:hypothetical protein